VKLKKALETINYNAYFILKGGLMSLEHMDESEKEELQEAHDIVEEFLYQFK